METYLRSLDDPDGIIECLATYGAVGVTGVLGQEDLEATHLEAQGILRELSGDSTFDLYDLSTVPAIDGRLNAFGVIGKDPLMTTTLIKNRYHPNVQRAFSIAYQTDVKNLMARHDRLGWLRPTVGPKGEDWSKYRTIANVHLDVDPKAYFEPDNEKLVRDYLNNNEYKVPRDLTHEGNVRNCNMGLQLQGVLNLFDNKEEDGGFCFVPGGHLLTSEWYEKKKDRLGDANPNGRYTFTKADSRFSWAVRLPCPAGTLIIFDCRLPHGTKPNFSHRQRMVQFLQYVPRSVVSSSAAHKRRRKYLEKLLKDADVKLTPKERRSL